MYQRRRNKLPYLAANRLKRIMLPSLATSLPPRLRVTRQSLPRQLFFLFQSCLGLLVSQSVREMVVAVLVAVGAASRSQVRSGGFPWLFGARFAFDLSLSRAFLWHRNSVNDYLLVCCAISIDTVPRFAFCVDIVQCVSDGVHEGNSDVEVASTSSNSK